MINLRQAELAIWQQYNFGTPEITHCALGVAEEAGEVCHHVLKGLQRIRGGKNGIDAAQVADGVADILIYGIQLLSLLGVDAEKAISDTIETVLKRDWVANRDGDKKEIQK